MWLLKGLKRCRICIIRTLIFVSFEELRHRFNLFSFFLISAVEIYFRLDILYSSRHLLKNCWQMTHFQNHYRAHIIMHGKNAWKSQQKVGFFFLRWYFYAVSVTPADFNHYMKIYQAEVLNAQNEGTLLLCVWQKDWKLFANRFEWLVKKIYSVEIPVDPQLFPLGLYPTPQSYNKNEPF